MYTCKISSPKPFCKTLSALKRYDLFKTGYRFPMPPIFIPMQILPNIKTMNDLIWIGSVELQEKGSKQNF